MSKNFFHDISKVVQSLRISHLQHSSHDLGIGYQNYIKFRTLSVRAGKNEKYREVPLFSSVKEAFQKYLPFRQALIEKKNRNTKSLLVNQYGEPISDEGGRNIIDRIARRAGIPFSPHRTRRFYGRYLWENSLKPELIQQLLGHSSFGTTMIYIQPDAEDAFSEVRKYMKKLDFKGLSGKGHE